MTNPPGHPAPDLPTETPLPAAPRDTPTRSGAARMVRPRLRKLLELLPGIAMGEDRETVHDVRVASRRLQQSIEALCPSPHTRRERSLRKTLRAVRRSLGTWRDCDVVLDLVARRQRRLRSPSKRAAWALVEEHVKAVRRKEIVRARRRLIRQDVGTLPTTIDEVIARRAMNGSATSDVLAAIDASISEWHAALDRARASRAVEDLHALRVATKRMRYRIELGKTLPHRDRLRWLKKLQEALGDWNDRQTLVRMAAEAIATPAVLLGNPGAARILLAELARERSRSDRDIDGIFRLADDERAPGAPDAGGPD